MLNRLVFVYDYHKSIAKSMALVLPGSFHALCNHHLRLNLTTKLNNDNMYANFILGVKTCRDSIFQYCFNKLAPCKGVQKYLTKVRLSK